MKFESQQYILILLFSLISACDSSDSNDPMQLCINSNVQLYIEEKLKPKICKGIYSHNLEEIEKYRKIYPQWNADFYANEVYKEMKINEDFCPKSTVSNFEKKDYFKDKMDEFKTICLKKFAR